MLLLRAILWQLLVLLLLLILRLWLLLPCASLWQLLLLIPRMRLLLLLLCCSMWLLLRGCDCRAVITPASLGWRVMRGTCTAGQRDMRHCNDSADDTADWRARLTCMRHCKQFTFTIGSANRWGCIRQLGYFKSCCCSQQSLLQTCHQLLS